MGDGDYAYTTTEKTEVSIPDWVENIEVGDVLTLVHQLAKGSFDATVVGFSTRESTEGYPVIKADDTPFETPSAETFAIEDTSVTNEVVEIEIDSGLDGWRDLGELIA